MVHLRRVIVVDRADISANAEVRREFVNGFRAIPFPPAVPERRHVYTMEAWMTNFEGEPRFAAATTAEVPVGY